MNCDDYRERVTVHLAEGADGPGDHGASCSDCARYAERARAAWEAAGRWSDEPVPPALIQQFQSSRRPRRADLTLLRPGPLAAAAILLVGAIFLLLRPGKPGTEERSDYESDGMTVERYELPAGVDAARAAEEIRSEVAPEAWGGGECGIEAGDGFLRVRAPAEIQRAVRDHLRKRQK